MIFCCNWTLNLKTLILKQAFKVVRTSLQHITCIIKHLERCLFLIVGENLEVNVPKTNQKAYLSMNIVMEWFLTSTYIKNRHPPASNFSFFFLFLRQHERPWKQFLWGPNMSPPTSNIHVNLLIVTPFSSLIRIWFLCLAFWKYGPSLRGFVFEKKIVFSSLLLHPWGRSLPFIPRFTTSPPPPLLFSWVLYSSLRQWGGGILKAEAINLQKKKVK